MKRDAVVVVNHSMSNPFEIFGLPIQFNLEEDRLQSAYLRAQAAIHPDLFINRSDLEKRMAASQATTLNEAYTRLKNPLTRAEDFLKAKGVNVPGSHGATVALESLLSEVLEWRDRIQEGHGLEQLHNNLSTRLEKCEAAFDTTTPEHLPRCYLEFVYTYKTLTELKISLEK